jgi:alpha-N-acetylglucosamine transferase
MWSNSSSVRKTLISTSTTTTTNNNNNEKNNRGRLLSLGRRGIFLLGIAVGIVFTETHRGMTNIGTTQYTEYLRPLELQAAAAADSSFNGGVNTVAVTGRSNDDDTTKKKKYAIAVYVEKSEHLYGAYTIAQQSIKTGLYSNNDVEFVIISKLKWNDEKNPNGLVLKQWLKEGLIHKLKNFDSKSVILDKINGGLWPGVFNKLLFFNLIEYDKVITLDCDIFIGQNIYHSFIDYDTPAACQSSDKLEWNSGAMVITPSTELFNALINKLPEVQPWRRRNQPHIKFNLTNYNEPDPFLNRDSGNSDQNYLTSFFTTDTNPASKYSMKTMPKQNAVLSSELLHYKYSWYRRNHIYDIVHLAVDKPWRIREKRSNGTLKSPIICMVLYEFHTSKKDIHDKYPTIDSIYHHIQNECPDTTTTFDNCYRIATTGIDTDTDIIGSSSSSSSSAGNTHTLPSSSSSSSSSHILNIV